ncbi:MAG: hypothetical protein N2A40_00645 [Desulfobulbaceae bacterium]
MLISIHVQADAFVDCAARLLTVLACTASSLLACLLGLDLNLNGNE